MSLRRGEVLNIDSAMICLTEPNTQYVIRNMGEEKKVIKVNQRNVYSRMRRKCHAAHSRRMRS